LRLDLDFMPSPAEEHPGLLIRDARHFSDAILIVPPLLVEALACFDGKTADLDLRAMLVRLTGDLNAGDLARALVEALSTAGFLEDGNFARMERERRSQFAAEPLRQPAHAGGAYPAEPDALRQTLARYMDGAAPAPVDSRLMAIAAPHASPEGGVESYRAAYRMLRAEDRERTFVILSTSHYGPPERFGLTRKNFVTPLGESETDTTLVDWLAARAPGAIEMEDYCHSFEHTVELELIFLQHALGPRTRILPILCGSFAKSLIEGGKPERNDDVRRFIDALAELRERESSRLFWILGVDMAHMGARYQDPFQARAGQGAMNEVEARDRARIARINAGDADGFWDLVRQNRDDLKWCGSSPFYTFLKTAPGARGELLSYEQWNIDEASVVSFAGMAFSEPR
jgi:AmmeMemoRadiSam system protein B